MSLLSLLDKTCNVQRQTVNLDPTGANNPAWTNRLMGIPCALSTDRSAERPDFQRDDSLDYFKLTTAQATGCTTADRVIIGGVIYPVRVAEIYASNLNIDPTVVYTTRLVLRRI